MTPHAKPENDVKVYGTLHYTARHGTAMMEHSITRHYMALHGITCHCQAMMARHDKNQGRSRDLGAPG